MTHAVKATMEIVYFDARPARTDIEADVQIDNLGLTLTVRDGPGEPEVWRGERRGQGHYLLRSADVAREASLHRFEESGILEGFWRNGSERGFWRLHMPDVTPALLQARDPAPERMVSRTPERPARRKRTRVAA